MNKLVFIYTIVFSSLLFTGCQIERNTKHLNSLKGEGAILSKILSIEKFDAIELNISDDVFIKQGNIQEVRIEGHPNIIEKLKTKISNGTWNIDLEPGSYNSYELKIFITTPFIHSIKVNGAGDVVLNDFANLEKLDIQLIGSGDIEFSELKDTKNLSIQLIGNGDITGRSEKSLFDKTTINIEGSGEYYGFFAPSKRIDVSLTGSGDCEVNAVEELNANLTGSGDIRFKGNAKVTKTISGSGNIEKQSN